MLWLLRISKMSHLLRILRQALLPKTKMALKFLIRTSEWTSKIEDGSLRKCDDGTEIMC
ncbi:hypothetical protein CAEBREN_24103 [Caenorhabditis brenneri]|uniref:Uncharacterized protein n=1 Tax=Caenorhabditis brenneri TaxID=135651 RepID=G0MLP7_CAEBE|nr:hypothetical protein CAEBREN_24103 [Caenorhabditis brenneri]